MAETFLIPREPIQDEYGFVLVPVMQGGVKRGRCKLCNQSCKPDRHHAYWPKPAGSEKAEAERLRIYGRLPDLSVDPYSALRAAAFSISGLVCRNWHDALHKLQKPPTELPDSDITELALHQYNEIAKLSSQSEALSSVIKLKRPALKRIETGLEMLRLRLANFPQEIVVPQVGYYCVVGSQEERLGSIEPPVTFDPESYRVTATEVLNITTSFLENQT
jgi:hypothetical protein